MDPVGKLAETLAGVAMPGGGLVVGAAGGIGGLAATNNTQFESTTNPDCPPGSIDLGCYSTRVSEGAESILGSGVPDFWVALESVPAGTIASLFALGAVLLVAFVIAATRDSTEGPA